MDPTRTLALLAAITLVPIATAASGPVNLDVAGQWLPKPGAPAIAVTGRYAYVAEPDCGLRVLDTSNPVQPRPVGSLAGLGNGRPCAGVVVGEDWVLLRYYVSSQLRRPAGGFRIIRVSDPALPVELGRYESTTNGFDALAVHGTRVFAAYSGNDPGSPTHSGLRVLDLADPAALSPMGSLALPGIRALAVADSGRHVFAAGLEGFQVVDVSAPGQPTLVGHLPLPWTASDVAIRNGYAYVGADGGLLVVDVRKAAQPRLVATHPTESPVARVAAERDQVLLLGTTRLVCPPTVLSRHAADALEVVDVTDPTQPWKASVFNLTGLPCAEDLGFSVGHVFLNSGIVVRLTEARAAAPALELRSQPWATRPDLWVRSPGSQGFDIQTATQISAWIPYVTVINSGQLQEVTAPGWFFPEDEPARFFRAMGTFASLDAKRSAWFRSRETPGRYRVDFERSCKCFPMPRPGRVTVDYSGGIQQVESLPVDGQHATPLSSDGFLSVEGLFSLLETERQKGAQIIIQFDPEQHYPARVRLSYPNVSENKFYFLSNLVRLE